MEVTVPFLIIWTVCSLISIVVGGIIGYTLKEDIGSILIVQIMFFSLWTILLVPIFAMV